MMDERRPLPGAAARHVQPTQETSMKALVSTPDGPAPAEIRDVEEPQPAAGELLIQVEAASLNRGELALLPARPGWRPGQDVAGVVLRAAGEGGPAPGTRVAAVVDQGGWAERVAAPLTRVGVLPEGVSMEAGATLGVAGLTALRALRVAGSLLGARVLVTGAAGGVGRFAVPLASMGGADVTAVVGGVERARGLTEIGASRTLLEGEDLDGPYDAVMEGVGGPSLERSVRALAPGGVAVLYGAAAGEPARLALSDFAAAPGARVHGFFVYQTGVETFGRDLSYLARLMGTGRLEAQVGLQVSWRDLGSATEALRERRVNGKVVLKVD
jgi:NADPH2:quinone reductase